MKHICNRYKQFIAMIVSFGLIVTGMPRVRAERYLAPLGSSELSGFPVKFEHSKIKKEEKDFVEKLIHLYRRYDEVFNRIILCHQNDIDIKNFAFNIEFIVKGLVSIRIILHDLASLSGIKSGELEKLIYIFEAIEYDLNRYIRLTGKYQDTESNLTEHFFLKKDINVIQYVLDVKELAEIARFGMRLFLSIVPNVTLPIAHQDNKKLKKFINREIVEKEEYSARVFYTYGLLVDAADAAFTIEGLDIRYERNYKMHKLFGDIFYEVNQGKPYYLPVRTCTPNRPGVVLALTLAVKHYNIYLTHMNRHHEDWHYINERFGRALYALSFMKKFEKNKLVLLNKAIRALENADRKDVGISQLLIQVKQEFYYEYGHALYELSLNEKNELKKLILLDKAASILKNAVEENAAARTLLFQVKQALADAFINPGNKFKSEGQYEKAIISFRNALRILDGVPGHKTKPPKPQLHRVLENLHTLAEAKQPVAELRAFFGGEVQKNKQLSFEHAVPEKTLDSKKVNPLNSSL